MYVSQKVFLLRTVQCSMLKFTAVYKLIVTLEYYFFDSHLLRLNVPRVMVCEWTAVLLYCWVSSA